MNAIVRVELYHVAIPLPAGSGLGISIDPAALRKYGKRFFVMDRMRLVWYSIRTRGIAASREIDRVKKARKKQAGSQ